MPIQPRVTITLVSLVCLYSVFKLKGQTELDLDLVKFRENFAHILDQAGDLSQWTTSPSASSTSDALGQAQLPHIQRLCSETDWIPNFWLHCHNGCGPNKTSFCGGLNNARNRVQTCLRWAIDAGAGLILPPVTMRGDDLINTNGEQQCLDAWWDLHTLQDAMAVNCPQLQLRAACDGLNHTDVMLPLGGLTDTATIVRPPHREVPDPRWTKGTFRQNVSSPALQTAAESAAAAMPASKPTNTDERNGNITIFEYGDAYLGWDYRVSNELDTIRKELHLALPFRADLLELGDTIARSPQLDGGAFIGVHLRGESDWPAAWGNLDQQMSLYEAEMLRIREITPDGAGVSAVYVSSGSQQAIQSFRERLEPLNFTVHDKWTILQGKPEELALVDAMDFDSNGIIDYEVLVQSRFYMGVSLFFFAFRIPLLLFQLLYTQANPVASQIFMSTMSKYVAYTRTADDEKDFFDTHIFSGVNFVGGDAIFPEPFTIRGTHYTGLLVTNGYYIMDSFP